MAAPQAGQVVTKDGEQVGTITSAGGEVGLGLLRRGVEPDELVTVGERQAIVEALPTG
jgi:hypothetical protein